MDLRTKSIILELEDSIKEVHKKITYYISVKQRAEEESKYIDDDSCSIMMSAIDKKILQEIHVPICLDKSISKVAVDAIIRQCNIEIKTLKAQTTKLESELSKYNKVK